MVSTDPFGQQNFWDLDRGLAMSGEFGHSPAEQAANVQPSSVRMLSQFNHRSSLADQEASEPLTASRISENIYVVALFIPECPR